MPELSEPVLFLTGLLGLLVHYLKKRVRGQSLHSVVQYFGSHFSMTVVSLVSYLGAFYALMQSGTLNVPAALMCGYMADSFFNKGEGEK